MDYNVLLLEICKQLQRKYNHVCEIHRMTREMGEAISRDDQVCIHMILEMRRNEMDKADECDKTVGLLIDSLPTYEKGLAQTCLKPDDSQNIEEEIYQKIAGISKNIRSILIRCIEIDKIINRRTTGAESFYLN